MSETSNKKYEKPKVTSVPNPQINRVFLQLIPSSLLTPLFPIFRGFTKFILRFRPTLQKDLKKIDYTISADDYVVTGLLNYSLIGSVLGLLMVRLVMSQENFTIIQAVTIGILVGAVLVGLLLFLALNHPVSTLKEKAVEIDKYLLYSLRDLSLHVSSGSTIYDALALTAASPYGEASAEFNRVVNQMYVGIPMKKVLLRNIERSQSDSLKKVYWQIINSLQSGSDLRSGLATIIADLDATQKAQIENYARELSLWSLLYMMFAVAVPTIGLTMMVILSAFAGFGLTQTSFILFLGLAFVAQIILIYFVKSRRPVVDF